MSGEVTTIPKHGEGMQSWRPSPDLTICWDESALVVVDKIKHTAAVMTSGSMDVVVIPLVWEGSRHGSW